MRRAARTDRTGGPEVGAAGPPGVRAGTYTSAAGSRAGGANSSPCASCAPADTARRALQLRLHALDGQQRAQLLAQRPHRPHRRGTRQQGHVQLHQVGREVREQPQGYVAVAHAVRADPEALVAQDRHRLQQRAVRHVRERRTDVDRHLPRQPPGLPHRVPQRGQPAEIGEGPGEHVDVQRQQRLLAGRRPHRQRGQTAVEFGVAAGLRQDVTGLRTGEYLQSRHPSGRQVDDRLEGEADSIRPGGHGSIMAPPAHAQAQFTSCSRRIPGRHRA